MRYHGAVAPQESGKKSERSPYAPPAPSPGVLRSDLPAGAFEAEEPSALSRRADGYGFLRAMRWVIRVVAVLYLVLTFFEGLSLAGFLEQDSGRADERGLMFPPARARGIDTTAGAVFVAVYFTRGLAIAAFLLTFGEAIQLGLDIRGAQLATGRRS